MIRNFSHIDAIAREGTPVRLAALATDQEEFLRTIKIARDLGYITPILIGERETICRVAQEVQFDLSSVKIHEERDLQAVANKGIELLFDGEADIAMKGHIPTSFVYRSIIHHEKLIRGRKSISVNTLWDVPGADHLITITDTGVSIAPGYETKKRILAESVFLMRLLGYPAPRVMILSASGTWQDGAGKSGDRSMLKADADRGDFGPCEVLEAASLWELYPSQEFMDISGSDRSLPFLPHVFMVPHLDAGNILSKLDFILDVTRRSLVMTSRGPVIIPSRSDTHQAIVGEVALGVVVARRLRGMSP